MRHRTCVMMWCIFMLLVFSCCVTSSIFEQAQHVFA